MEHKMKTFCLLILFFFSNIGFASAQYEPTKRDFEIFRSRAQVEKKLGQKIAVQIPNYFDFKHYGLVWVPKKATVKDPKVLILEPGKDRSYFRFTAISEIAFTRFDTSKTSFVIVSDGYHCMGPAFPPRDQADEKRRNKKSAACRRAARKQQKVMNGQLYLFALPKKELKALKGTHRRMEPPP